VLRHGPLRTLTPYDTSAAPPSRIDLRTLAGRCAQRLREQQPHGPYTVGGWSLGGLVAWETAAVLRAEGAPVRRVILIDSVPFFDVDAGLPVDLDRGARFERFCEELRRSETPVAEATLAAVRMAVSHGGAAPGLEGEAAALLRSFAWAEAMLLAARDHRLPRLDCPVSYLRPRHGEGRAAPWAARADGEFSEIELPGDHHSVMRHPHVRATAAAIDALLEAKEAVA
jgi:thioesterase domain-containing protein